VVSNATFGSVTLNGNMNGNGNSATNFTNLVTTPVGANVNFNGYSPTNALMYGFAQGATLTFTNLNTTNGWRFYNPVNGSNYWILTP